MEEILNIKLYTVQEVGKILSLGDQSVYGLIRRGRLSATKIGRNYMISEANLKDYLNGK